MLPRVSLMHPAAHASLGASRLRARTVFGCHEEGIRVFNADWVRRQARRVVPRLLLGVAMVMSVAVTAQAMVPAGTHRAVRDLRTPVAGSSLAARPTPLVPEVAVDLRDLYPIYRWIIRKAVV